MQKVNREFQGQLSKPVETPFYLYRNNIFKAIFNMTQNLYTTFRKFLRDNDCERQFDAAFYEQCGAGRLDETLADILVTDEAFFGRVFDWRKTPEGREFWKGIDKRWWDLYLAR